MTNGSAELSAQAWAMMIAFEYVAKHKVGRIEIRYDSKVAAGATMATIKAKEAESNSSVNPNQN